MIVGGSWFGDGIKIVRSYRPRSVSDCQVLGASFEVFDAFPGFAQPRCYFIRYKTSRKQPRRGSRDSRHTSLYPLLDRLAAYA